MDGALPSSEDPYDLSRPEVWDDPYPIYDRLRREEPVWRGLFGSYLISRHGDVKEILRNPSLVVSSPVGPFAEPPTKSSRVQLDEVTRSLERWVTFTREPRHRSLRAFLQAEFRRPYLQELEPRIRTLAAELLRSAEARGSMEAVGDLAYPLPALVIAELLGFPRETFDQIRRWSRVMTRFFDDHLHRDADLVQEMHGIHEEARELVAELLEDALGRDPGRDLFSRLARGRETGEISDEEILANCMNLLFAGHETTMSLIGSGLWHLLRRPEAAKILVGRPERIPTAVEELLRFESPAPYIGRTAVEDVELHGTTIRRGESLVLLLGAANRDPEVFENPDRLDLARRPNPHLAFGHGAHICLGASLARLEAQIVFELLVEKLDRLELLDAGAPRWREARYLRGLATLPVGFAPN